MRSRNIAFYRIILIAAFLICAVLTASALLPLAARAEESDGTKIVRVGWDEPPFGIMDQSGRRSGYAYDYQQKIAAYTGWTYEFVEGSWPDLMQMLIDGEIDMMDDVSYTEERSKQMLFPELPMGTEEYYLFVTPEHFALWQNNYESLTGKRVGVLGSSIQKDLLLKWAETQNVRIELVELDSTEEESLQKLKEGFIDALVTLDTFGNPETAVPLCEIGSSDFYFAINRNRPDLLKDLNQAMNKIQEENRYYNWQLYEKYLRNAASTSYLDSDELRWLSAHGKIRVGYQDNYLAFCASDGNGELTGALKDFLEIASRCLKNAELSFEAVAYPTAEEAEEALKRGEVDCAFPANFTDYDADTLGMVMSPPLMSTDMYAVVREAEQQSFVYREEVTAAVNQGNPNYDMFLPDHFPNWKVRHYPDTASCLRAVAEGEADCILISSYRFNNISKQCQKLHLATVTTGVDMNYCFATRKGDTTLYSILASAAGLVPASTVNAALNYYSTEDVKESVGEFLMNHLAAVIALIASVVILVLVSILHSVRSQQRAEASEKLISATEHDELTGLFNRSFFYEFANRIHREHPEKPMDSIVVNIDQFHSVNELHGRDFGDQVLKKLGEEIRVFLDENEGIGSRLNVDDYYIFCTPQKDYQALLDRFQNRINQLSKDAGIRLRMGVMPWKEGMDPVQQLDRAHTACNRVRGSDRHYVVYDEKMLEREHLNERLLNDLDRALREHEFRVFYQPKFNITVDPPALSSSEALVRWQHPELGMIAPNKFIPLFEENGLIQKVDRFVWREVASQMSKWREKYGRVFPVSVNVSRIDLYDPDFASTVSALLKEFSLRREDFLLEITESAYTEDSEQIVENVKKLREAGYLIEMDDFGSGYSSLNMISTLPIDIIKLDMQFVRNAFQGRSDTRMLEAVLGIAEMLYLPTVAEGVETAEQLHALRSMGCDVVQGYYFSRPVPAEEYEAFIEQRMNLPEDVAPIESAHHLPHLSDEDYSYDELHDPLTGLYNYSAFTLLVKDAERYHTALLITEVLEENQIMSKQDQITAERVIRHVADILRRSFRPVDHICRIRNLKFAVIMSRVDSSICEQVAQKIDGINEYLSAPDNNLPAVSLAVGVAFADRRHPGDSILEDAESALSGLKEQGLSGCKFH